MLGALLALALLITALPTRANDTAHAPAHAAAPEPEPAAPSRAVKPKAAASGTVAAEPAPARERPARIEARNAKDPLDTVRERLALKLGATAPADAAKANVLRVVSKTSAPVAAEREPLATTAAPRRSVPAAPHGAARADGHGAGGAAHAAHWDYVGDNGPESWGQMKPEFSKCATGLRQSPIDIRDGIKVSLDPVQFDYKPGSFKVIDNGHTVQVNVGAGSSIEVLGRRYELVQFHFHRPSEERIEGKQFDMVAHLVHKDLEGRLAVVAVLLDRGSAQPLVQSVWNNLPLEKNEEVPARGTLNLAELLPTERSYFTYMGSLTTPPCSEGVLWMVLKNPVSISPEQIGIFSRLYPMNARPIQAASGRLIKESN